MKKQVITIEREVPDTYNDDATREYVEQHLANMWDGPAPMPVSVVSEPIPEPIAVRVEFTPAEWANADAVREHVQRALIDSELFNGSFHVEVIPQ